MPDSTLPTAVQPRQHALLRVQPGKRRPLLQRLTWERLKTIALTLIFGYPAAVLIRLVSPLVRIRVGEIPVNRIGYILPTADLYLCEKTEWRGRRPLDLVYFSGPSVNSAAYEMVRRKIRPVPWARFIAGPNARLPGAENHVIEFRYFDSDGIRARVGPTLELDPKWIRDGDAWLESLGVAQDQPVILIANRDQAHLDNIHPEMNWDYHDYRNTDIEKMRPMAEYFAAKGYAVIRMGANVAASFESNSPLIIDYAWSHRTPERDIYLGARCKFFIGPTSGISELVLVFRKPFGAINVAPFMTTMNIGGLPIYFLDGLWMPKHLRRKLDGRFLSAREIIELGAHQFYSSGEYEAAGIDLVENSAEEITDFAIELEKRLSGDAPLEDQDEMLYASFWQKTVNADSPSGRAPIAISFLRNHPYLIR